MIWLQLSAGRGPPECEYFVAHLVPRICEAATKQHLTTMILDEKTSAHGLLSALIAIEGDDALAFATTWNGSLKWICKSPVRPENRRRNWFISGQMIEPPSVTEPWDARDLRYETYRASGPGGQHVNVTSSAVRVTHVPTGQTAQAQEERSQYRNKALATARLAMVFRREAERVNETMEQAKWQQHDQLERGNAIRVFRNLDFAEPNHDPGKSGT